MTIRAQMVSDWLPRKFTEAMRAAVLCYDPLLLHDGYLLNCRAFNRHLRHILTFSRMLTTGEIALLIGILETN